MSTPSRRSALLTVALAARLAPSLRRGFGLSVALMLLGTAGQVVAPIVIQRLLDRHVLAEGPIDLTAVAQGGAVAAVAVLVAILSSRIAMFRLLRAAAEGLAELRVRTFRHIHDLSVLHVEAERRGTLVARVTADVEAINDFLEWGGVGMLVGAAQITLVVGVMLFYNPALAVLVTIAATLYALALLAFQRILRRAFDKVRRRNAATLAAMSEAISGLPTIRAHGAEERTLERVGRALSRQRRQEIRTWRLGATLFSSAEVFAASVTTLVIVAGILLGAGAGLTPGTLVAFLFLVTLFIEPLQMLVEVLNEAQTAAAGMRRVLEVLDEPAEIADPDDGLDLPPGRLDVRFEHVRFRYPTGPDVLHDLTVDIPAGARVAVVGETGSGKSTFVKLLVRLLDPTAGRILIGGVPLTRVRFASLRSRVAFVPQEGFLFDTTIADNVRYGAPEADDTAIEQAFEELGLRDWVESLPDGIRTPVGERGGRLSAGERQLVALVRSWIADADLLVLDEATSAVDPALEVRLRRAMERLTADRTSVTVAHRLSTAEAADEVLVFDAGRLVERGPHDELVARGGVYAGLHADWMATAGS